MVGQKSNDRENWCQGHIVAEVNYDFPFMEELWFWERSSRQRARFASRQPWPAHWWAHLPFPLHLSCSGSCSRARFGDTGPPGPCCSQWALVSLLCCGCLQSMKYSTEPPSHPQTNIPMAFSYLLPLGAPPPDQARMMPAAAQRRLMPSLSHRSGGGSSVPCDYQEVGFKQNNLELFFLFKTNYWGVFIYFLSWKLVFLWLMAKDWVIESINSFPTMNGTWAGECIGFGTVTDWTISVSLPQQDSVWSK